MIHAGVGATHLNSIFVTIGLPSINPKTLKRRERDIGPVIETAAKSSCADYSRMERKLTLDEVNPAGDNKISLTFEQALEFLETDHENENEMSPSPMESFEQVEIDTVSEEKPSLADETVSQDAAWSKRGKAMNSLSGVGHVIGLKTRKCLNFSTRKKKCKRCSHYERKQVPIPRHDCRPNWIHSARSMEADIAVQLHREATENNIKYANVIGDEDSSAIKQIRDQVNSDVEKFSDFTHIKRSLTNKLQDLSKKHKSLTEKVRQAFLKNFIYAVHQNKYKTQIELQNALNSIVPHMYGDHSTCGKWCGYVTNMKSYKHVNLPFGKDLSDVRLKESLQCALEPFIKNPFKLMTSVDSQPNESLNNVIFSKAPKIRNYSMSESFDFRCAAGICQFNDGKNYINAVIKDSNLSPRKETNNYTIREERKRKYLNTYKSRKVNKKRRIELKYTRKQKEKVSEIKLGKRYETDCCWVSDNVDTTEINDPKKEETLKCDPNTLKTVFFDLETTSLGYQAEITQIGACASLSETFNTYIIPNRDISYNATKVSGLEVKSKNGTRQLLKNGEKVDATNPKEGLTNFISWLSTFRAVVVTLFFVRITETNLTFLF